MSPATTLRTVRAGASARREESGWVLAAALILSTLAIAVTVTYARHAVLAKKSLEFAQGASPVEEATRSGMERVRERMLQGDPPGTVEEGTQDHAVTPGGEDVTGERQVLGNQMREIRVRATSTSNTNGSQSSDEFNTKARGKVAPGSGSTQKQTTVNCPDGSQLIAGNLTIISGNTAFTGVELAGLMLLEDGATLTLQDCILRGTIITRHGACNDHPACVGANRPRIQVYGGLRLLAGTDLPDTAMCAPDAVFDADPSARVEIDGFACADELTVKGHSRMHGMVITDSSETIDSTVKRPGPGRGYENYPQSIDPGIEELTNVVFPNDPIPAATLDVMAAFDAGNP
jgi:hypothetical protein